MGPQSGSRTWNSRPDRLPAVSFHKDVFKVPLTPAPSPTPHSSYDPSAPASSSSSSSSSKQVRIAAHGASLSPQSPSSPNRSAHQLQQQWANDDPDNYKYHVQQLRSHSDEYHRQHFASLGHIESMPKESLNAMAMFDSLRDQFMTLDDNRKSMFLHSLLSLCSTNVLSSASEFISPFLKRDPFAVLPNELSLKIVSYIDDPQTLARASQVSKLWYLILSDDLTWKQLCNTHHFRRLSAAVTFRHDRSRVPSIAGNLNGAATEAGVGEVSEAYYNPAVTKRPVPTSYRSHFKQQYLLNSAWSSGGKLAARYVISVTAVVTALVMDGRYIVIGLDDSKIFVFREDGRMVRSLFGHVMGVWTLALRGNTLVSGGCDRTVRVWDLTTGSCTQILEGHSSTVRCLQMVDESTALSGSRDGTVRVWDIKKGECSAVFEGHEASVRCLAVHGDLCVSGSYDYTAKVWRISTGHLEHTLVGHHSQIYCVAFDGERIATGSLDASVRIWSPVSGECLAVLQGHTSLVGHIQMSGSTLVSGGSDGAIRIWDLDKRTCIHRIAAHDNSVTCLQFDSERIVSGGSDGKVEVWEMATGKHVRSLSGPFDGVWQVAIKDEKVVILAVKSQKIHMELVSFTPSHDALEASSTVSSVSSSTSASLASQLESRLATVDTTMVDLGTSPTSKPADELISVTPEALQRHNDSMDVC